MLPPLHYQGLDAPQPFGYQPPPAAAPMMHPARVAALSGGVGVGVPPPMGVGVGMGPGPGAGPGPQLGMVRSADEMDGGEEGHPPAKRQKVAKLPGGQYYPEQDWINLHPHSISLQVRLPNDPSKPEYKLDGSVVTVPDLPLNLLISTLRDRILQYTGSAVPASRIRLAYDNKMLTNANTLASYNLEDEDLLVLSVREAKRR
ncbi:hypothetical protein NLI96_g10473 [Meripilus lineatus]|uniref:Ubiquitin-like domain-containing protein n=1 Tax=Meripilus lineatus TaxID=2056292 RepID=A0AAD5YE69_9APHY|nr:hypothetical protein NLI96_g10473 [Physisporinus lineatus]